MGVRGYISRRRLLEAGAIGGTLALAGAGTATPGAAPRVQRYVPLGNTGLSISDISFGSSRLREGQEDLVRHALACGVNYFDTAESYTRGASERVLGRALVGRHDEIVIATKMFAGSRTTWRRMMDSLEGSLARLRMERVDIVFNHAVNDVERLDNPQWAEFVMRARTQGKMRFVGMSGHAGRLVPCLEHAIDLAQVDVVLVAYNFGQDPAFYERLTGSFDLVATQPELPRVLARARAGGVGTIAMKTLMGARLNDLRPYEAGGHTFAQAAFRWTLANPDVDALIVSMTSREQINEYLAASGGQAVSGEDMRLLEHYAHLNAGRYCRHGCDDCAGACPHGVPIADVLRMRMYAVDYRDPAFARSEYAGLAVNAEPCVTCSGQPCRDACSHGLGIDRLCKPIHGMLS